MLLAHNPAGTHSSNHTTLPGSYSAYTAYNPTFHYSPNTPNSPAGPFNLNNLDKPTSVKMNNRT